MIPVLNGLTHLTGVYSVPAAHVTVRALLTNTGCTSPYRGAGRPETVFCCERLMDLIARRLEMDPIALRRRNLVPGAAMPWLSPLGTRLAGVDFGALLDRALEASGAAGFAARRTEARMRGRLRGRGVCLFAEDLHGSAEPLPARLAAEHGRLVLLVGSGSSGHGHETSFRQVAAERLGIALDQLGFVQSDTARIPDGIGTAASWSLTLGGGSVRLAADAAVEAGRVVAASLLGVAPGDVGFAEGVFRSPLSNRALVWDEILAAEPGFSVTGVFTGYGQSLPVGCHVYEVEVDPETGVVAVTGYAIAQDAGILVNPMLVEGQLHGGVAQSLGQGWMEAICYDDDGQLLSGSFMDYGLPRATDLPGIATALIATSEADNPLGVKGIGESAATGSTPAFVNAVLHALAPFGIDELEMPLTPNRVWAAIAGASGLGDRSMGEGER